MHACKAGHPLRANADYDPALLKLGKRRCGRCAAIYRREYKRRKRREAGPRPRGPYERRAACLRGHPLTPENRKGGDGECLTCHREREARARRRRGVAERSVVGRCSRGHDLTDPANRRTSGRGCAICHRLRSLKDADAITYGTILLGDPCAYCGGSCEEIDHVEAFALGGANSWQNLTASCGSCNARKRTRSLLTYLLEAA